MNFLSYQVEPASLLNAAGPSRIRLRKGGFVLRHSLYFVKLEMVNQCAIILLCLLFAKANKLTFLLYQSLFLIILSSFHWLLYGVFVIIYYDRLWRRNYNGCFRTWKTKFFISCCKRYEDGDENHKGPSN